ncbi:ribbon-helix-helix domain-containing protein [Helicobacter baculiformis]|uniref:Ribbon-helix-helix domain-containing protein n=1 Tax=Helicobacter baculiformis TaxID=427351 RepID=A0ABV7ZK71_9HELI|nr:ribbon-helix-helix domain-containing protein [Helicobacter baculiformis]
MDSIDAALNRPITQENTFQNKQENKKRKKPGRKRVPTDELKKNYAVQLYFSKEEYKKLEQLAYEEAESISSYIKRQIVKMLR